MAKIIGLVRASSIQQELDSQRVDLQRYILSKGFSEEDIIWHEIHASATKCDEDYVNFIDELKNICLNKNIDNVAVWHLNRLGRTEKYLFDIKNFFLENKIQLFCCQPDFQLLNPDKTENKASTLVWNIYAEIIRSETDERQTKLRRGRLYKMSQSLYTGGRILYGYSVNDKSEFLINPEEAAVVQRIFDMYLSRQHSTFSIAKELNLLKINKYSMEWTSGKIYRLLIDESYTGVSSQFGLTYPAIIQREIFDKVNEMLRDNKSVKTSDKLRLSLAAGLIVCPVCKRKYALNIRHYSCIARRNLKFTSKQCECKITLNASFTDSMVKDISLPLYVEHMYRLYRREDMDIIGEIKSLKTKISTLKEKRDTVKDRLVRLENEFYAGKFNENRFNELSDLNRTEFEKIDSEIRNNEATLEIISKRMNVAGRMSEIDGICALWASSGNIKTMSRENRELVRYAARNTIEEIVPYKCDEGYAGFKMKLLRHNHGENIDIDIRYKPINRIGREMIKHVGTWSIGDRQGDILAYAGNAGGIEYRCEPAKLIDALTDDDKTRHSLMRCMSNDIFPADK